jgi:hypothetical protein
VFHYQAIGTSKIPQKVQLVTGLYPEICNKLSPRLSRGSVDIIVVNF